MSDNIKVVVKVRPLISREIEDKLSFQWRVKSNTLYQLDSSGKESGTQYTFDKVYDETAKTEDVYKDVAKPIVEAAIAGFNGTIFAYGQTSSGKTYTMSGTEASPGIIQLAVLNLFDQIKCIPDRDFLVRVSYIEIYNEKLKDLLNGDNDKVKVRDTLQGVKVDATERFTSSPEEVLEIMKEGEANRQVGATNMNEESSRSHSIFQITIESREHTEGEDVAGCVNVSTLNLVDLAGSERSGQTGTTGKRFKEGTHINKSLSTLALVIKQLSEDPNKHTNCRDSKLTRILQNSLGGNAKTSVICAVTPAAVEETISTLQFANRAKAIKNKPEVNAVATDKTKLQDLTKQLSKLQSELAIKNNVEQDNLNLMKQISGLQKMILNGFGQHNIGGCRRKTWCAPRRMTISTLPSVEEDKEIAVQRFCTPGLKYNPLSLPNAREFQPIQRPSQLAPVSEEAIMITPPPQDKKVNCSDEIIDLDSDEDNTSSTSHCSPYHKCHDASKTPPCVLRKNAKLAEKNLQDIVELTKREKLYKPEVVEYIEKLEQSTLTISRLEEDLRNLSAKNLEKDSEVKQLKDMITQTENEIKTFSFAKAKLEARCNEYNTKITDLEVSYENLKMKAKLREDELLSLLNEHTRTKKPKESVSGKTLSRTFDKEFGNFMDLSKDISLVSDHDSSIDTSNSGEASAQLQELVCEMKTQITLKDETILNLEKDLQQQHVFIKSLETTCNELREQVNQTSSKLEYVDKENSLLKSSIETLNSTISSQKKNLETANKDIQSYNSIIQQLQTKLTEKVNNVDSIVSDNSLESMIAVEEKVIANNENLKNIINSFKIALDLRTREMETLKSTLEFQSSSLGDDLWSEQLKAKEVQINSLVEQVQKSQEQLDENMNVINELIQENKILVKNTDGLSEKLIEVEKKNIEFEKHNVELQKQNEEYANRLREFNDSHEKLLLNLSYFKDNLDEAQKEKEELFKLQDVVLTKDKLIADYESQILCKDNLITSLSNKHTELQSEVFTKDNLIADLKSNSLSKDSLISSLGSEHTEPEDYLCKFKSVTTKLQQLLWILTGDFCVETEIISDAGAIFNTLCDRLNDVEVTAKEVVSRRKVAVENENKLKQEFEMLQTRFETLLQDKHKTEKEKDNLRQQIIQLTTDLDKANTELLDFCNLKLDLEIKLQIANENIQKAGDDIAVKESLIINLQNKNSSLHLQMDTISQQDIVSKREIENLQLLINTNQATFEKLLLSKDGEIQELKHNACKRDRMLDENCIQLQKLSKMLDETVRNQDQLLQNINEKATGLVHKLDFQNDQFRLPDSNRNIYDSIIYILDIATNNVMSCRSVDACIKEMEEIKQKHEQLQKHYNQAIENLTVTQNKNKHLCNDLLKSGEGIQRLQIELKDKLNIIESLECKIKEWKDNFASLEESMKQQILDSQFSQKDSNDTYSIDRELSDLESCQRQTSFKSLTNILVEPGNASPQSLLTLCCNKILDVIQPSETDLKSVTSSSTYGHFENISAGTQTQPCNCDKLLAKIDITLEENLDLKAKVDFLQIANLNLIKEQEEIRKELQLLAEPAHDLQRKISNHRTNLSTLTATTYAENKLLKSQVKVLQHHNNRFLSVCQRDLPSFKKSLQELSTILKSTPLANKLDANIKRYSLPEVLDRSSSASNFKEDSTLDGDLLMLDINVTLASVDNTLLAPDQTCLDGTQMYLDSEINTDLIQTIDPNILHTQLHILSLENQKLTEKLQDLKKENYELHEKKDKHAGNIKPDIRQIDAQSSPIKLNNSVTEDSLENTVQITEKMIECNCNEKTSETHEKMTKEINLRTLELLEVKLQNSDLKKRVDELSVDIIANDKLLLKISTLEKEKTSILAELNQLTIKISSQTKQYQKLQEENDILSTQVMESIDESDILRKELDVLQDTNSVLTAKCEELEELIKSTGTPTNTATCLNCERRFPNSPAHSSLNRSHSDSESSSCFNKLSTLQNELLAGREDCKTISEDVASIKSHLERNNLSLSHNMDLDDSMGESNVFTFHKDLSESNPKTSKLIHVVPEESPLDIYALDKIDCFNYYIEKTEVENNLSQETKIIDVMKMFYNNLIAKHGNEVENLVNKLRDFEESRNQLHDKIDNISTEYSKICEEIKDKNNRINGVAGVFNQIRENVGHFEKEISGCDAEKSTVLVETFKNKLLNILDVEFKLSTVSIFESLIEKVVSKHHNDLLDIMRRYSDLQGKMEILTSEMSTVTDNLNQMKDHLSNKEKEYNLLKAQKEKVYEITNAVTLDIVQKERELSEVITKGYETLLHYNVVNPNDLDVTLPVNTNISLLIEKLIHQSKQNDLACQEKHNLLLVVTKSKTILEQKDQEIESLKSQLEKLHELCKEATNELLIKNEALETQKSLHEQLNEVYEKKTEENIANVKIIENLTQELVILKETVDEKENLLKTLQQERNDSETKAKIVELTESINSLEHENKNLKSMNDVIINESEQNAVQLARADDIIKKNKSELDKMTAEILLLNQSIKENMSVIESLKLEAKSLLNQNVVLKEQCHEANELCSQLKLNMKTHEKTAEIQCKIMSRLKQEKEDIHLLASEKNKEVVELTEKCEVLQKDFEKLSEDVNKSRREANDLKETKEALERRVSELEGQVDGAQKPRASLGVVGDNSRRRRQSLIDSKRIFGEGAEIDHKKMEAFFGTAAKPEDMFMDVDDHSNRSTPVRNRRSDSYQSRNEESERDDCGSRPGSALARRRRRQSTHDLHRNAHITPDHQNMLDETNKKNNGDPESDVSQLRDRLKQCQQELEELRERYREVDEECETCAVYLRERDEQCMQLWNDNKNLQQQIVNLNEKLQNASTIRSQDSRREFSDASVNTDQDWSNLHSVVVDRMSFDREVEKNKALRRTADELRFKNSELKATLAKMQKSVERAAKNKADLQQLEATKLELQTCKRELEECKERCKELDEECETCGEYLRERDEQLARLKQAKDTLEAKLEELIEKDAGNKAHSVRKKRQSLHDQNRNSVVEYRDAATETNEDLLSYQVERDNTSNLQSDEMQHLKMTLERLSQQKAALELQLHAVTAVPAVPLMPPVYAATGSAIVQNQHLTDVIKENQKLKKMNAKLITICKKRGKAHGDSNRENDDPDIAWQKREEIK